MKPFVESLAAAEANELVVGDHIMTLRSTPDGIMVNDFFLVVPSKTYIRVGLGIKYVKYKVGGLNTKLMKLMSVNKYKLYYIAGRQKQLCHGPAPYGSCVGERNRLSQNRNYGLGKFEISF
jgi:hypothetical protein